MVFGISTEMTRVVPVTSAGFGDAPSMTTMTFHIEEGTATSSPMVRAGPFQSEPATMKMW